MSVLSKENFNKNLSKMSPYSIVFVPKDVKRQHFNETAKPILPVDVLSKNVFEDMNYYPEDKYERLTKVAEKFYNINSEFVIPTNGSDEGIDLVIRTFCNPNDTILTLNPSFAMYKQYAEGFLCNTIEFNVKNDGKAWSFDTQKFIDFAKQNKVKMLFLSNPMAHLGCAIDRKDIIKITEELQDVVVVIDEAYIDFSSQKSILSDLKKYKNLVVLKTMSKFFGLAGIRLGLVFTHFKDEIFKIKSPDNVSCLTCKVGINLLENITNQQIEERKKEFDAKKNDLMTWLKTFDEVKQIFESETNFVLVELNCKANIFATKILENYKIKIKAMSGEFENYCRVSVL